MRGNAADAGLALAPEPLESGAINQVKDNGGYLTLGFWLTLLAIYLFWDVVVTRNRNLTEVIDAGNIRTNLYNLFFIGFAAVIFVNGFKVLLVKIAAWNIPGVSWVAEQILPFFQL